VPTAKSFVAQVQRRRLHVTQSYSESSQSLYIPLGSPAEAVSYGEEKSQPKTKIPLFCPTFSANAILWEQT
jgi:hypothetical protein